MRFKRKEKTHKTLSKVISKLNGPVPVEVIGTVDQVGKLTMSIGQDSVFGEMWSVAPLVKIQSLVKGELI